MLCLTVDIPNEADLNLVHATGLSYKMMVFGFNGMHSGYPFLLKTEQERAGRDRSRETPPEDCHVDFVLPPSSVCII